MKRLFFLSLMLMFSISVFNAKSQEKVPELFSVRVNYPSYYGTLKIIKVEVKGWYTSSDFTVFNLAEGQEGEEMFPGISYWRPSCGFKKVEVRVTAKGFNGRIDTGFKAMSSGFGDPIHNVAVDLIYGSVPAPTSVSTSTSDR